MCEQGEGWRKGRERTAERRCLKGEVVDGDGEAPGSIEEGEIGI